MASIAKRLFQKAQRSPTDPPDTSSVTFYSLLSLRLIAFDQKLDVVIIVLMNNNKRNYLENNLIFVIFVMNVYATLCHIG